MATERAARNMPSMVKNDEARRGLCDLSRAHRILDLEGHNDMSLGHCSMRDPWERGVWPELGKDLAECLGRGEAAFLRNHGIVSVGRTVKEMTLCAIFLEKACRAQLRLTASGLKHTPPPADEVEKKRKNIYPRRAIDNFWDYYNRRLDRLEGTLGVDKGENQ